MNNLILPRNKWLFLLLGFSISFLMQFSFQAYAGALEISVQTPYPNSTDHPVDQPITISFSANMNKSTLNTSNIYLLKSGTNIYVPIRISYVDSNRSVTLIPQQNLEHDTFYTVYLASNIHDVNENRLSYVSYSFATAPREVLQIAGVIPGADAENVPLDSTITIVFSNNMDLTTLNTFNIYLTKAGTNIKFPIELDYSESGRTVTVTPWPILEHDTRYEVHVTNKVRDAYGHHLTYTSWALTTIPKDETTIVDHEPRLFNVISTIPWSNQTGVTLDQTITVEFTNNVDVKTISNQNIFLKDKLLGTFVPTTFSYHNSDNRLIIRPLGKLTDNTTYVVTLTDQLADQSGNNLHLISWEFTTLAADKSEIITLTNYHPTVYIEGQQINFTDVKPYIKENWTLIPLRALYEAIGADVDYYLPDSQPPEITAQLDQKILKLFVGEYIAYVNEIPVNLDVAPEINNGRTMIPLRFVAESLGFEVYWDSPNNSIYIE